MTTERPTAILFMVEITSTDPPPDWVDKIEKRLARELFLLYGDNVTLARMLHHTELENR